MNIDILRSDFLNKCDINAYRKELQEILASLRSEVQRATLKETELGNNINNIIQTLEQYYDKTEINELLEGLRIVVADIVEENNSNPVSSQAVYAALQDRVMFVNIMPLVALDDISGKIGTSSKSPSEIKEAIVSRKLVIIQQVDQFYTALHINDTGVNILVMNTEGNLSVLTINNNKEVYKKDISIEVDTELNGESNNPLANSVIYRTIQALKEDKEILKFNGILTDSITIVDGTSESAGGIYYSEKNKMFVRDSGLAGEQYFRNWDAFGEYKASSAYNTNSILNKDKLYAIVTDKLDLYMYSSQEGKLVNINNSIIKEINNVKTTLSNTSSIQASITNVRPDVEDENLYVGSCDLGASTLKDYFDLGRPIFLLEEQLVLGGVQITDVVGDHVGGAGIIENNLYWINVYDPTELLDYNVYIRLIPINASTESRTIIADIMSDHVPSNTTEDSNRYAIVKELSGDYYIYKWVRDDHQTYDQGWTGTWVKLTDALANNRLVIYDGVIYLYLDKLLRQLTRDTNDFTNIVSNYPYLLPFNGFLTEEEDNLRPDATTTYAGTSGNPVLILFGSNNKFVLKAYEPLALGNINGYKYYKSWSATDTRQASTSYRLKENVIYYQIVDNTIEAYLYIDGELIPFSGGNSNKLPNIQLLHYSFYGRPTTDLVNGYYDITENGRHLDEYKDGTWIRHTAETLPPTYFLGENTLVKWEDGVLTDVVYPITPEFQDFDVLPFSTFNTDRVSTTILTEPTNGNVVFNTTMHQFLLEYLVGDDEYGYASEWPDCSALNIIGSRHYNLVNGTIRTDALFINLSVKESEYKTALYISNGSDLIEHKANTDNVINIKYWSTSEGVLNDLSTRYADLDYIYTEDTHKLFKYVGSGLVNVTPTKECIYIYLTNMYKWNGTLMVLLNSNSITPFIKILASGFTEPPATPSYGNGYYIYLNDDEVPAVFRYSNTGWTEFTDNAYVLWDGVLWLFSGGQLQETGISFGGNVDKDTVVDITTKDSTKVPTTKAVYEAIDLTNTEIDNIKGKVTQIENALIGAEVPESDDVYKVDQTISSESFDFKDNPFVLAKIVSIQESNLNNYNKNIVEANNTVILSGTLDSTAFQAANTTYVISSTVRLLGTYTIGLNSVLKFEEEGKCGIVPESSVVITGNNTLIINSDNHTIFDPTISFNGTWHVKTVYPEWWGAKGKLPEKYYNYPIICYNTTLHSNTDTNYEVIDGKLNAHVWYPNDYIALNGMFALEGRNVPGHYKNVYLWIHDTTEATFVLKYKEFYYVYWKNSEYWNTDPGDRNLLPSAKQSLFGYKDMHGNPLVFRRVITEDISDRIMRTRTTDTQVTINATYNGESHNVTIPANSNINLYCKQCDIVNASTREGTYNPVIYKGIEVDLYTDTNNTDIHVLATLEDYPEIELAGITEKEYQSLSYTSIGPHRIQYGLANFNSIFMDENAAHADRLYDTNKPYVVQDVYYDADTDRFLLEDPFNRNSEGKPILYTAWENSTIWNDDITGHPRTKVLYSNVEHDLVLATEVEDLEGIPAGRITKIYINNTLTPLWDILKSYYGSNSGDSKAINAALAFPSNSCDFKKNAEYLIGGQLTLSGKTNYGLNGNNALLYHIRESVTPCVPLRYSTYLQSHIALAKSGTVILLNFKLIFGGHTASLGKIHSNIVLLSITTSNNIYVQNLKMVGIKDRTTTGNGGGYITYFNQWGSEWKFSTSGSETKAISVGDQHGDCTNIYIQNIYANNLHQLIWTAGGSPGSTITKDLYADHIIGVRMEMAFVPKAETSYYSNIQVGQCSLCGPAGDHLIYGLTGMGYCEWDRCHFYQQDDKSGTMTTLHGGKYLKDRAVYFKDCLFEGNGLISGGGTTTHINLKNCRIIQKFKRSYAVGSNSMGYKMCRGTSAMTGTSVMTDFTFNNCDIRLLSRLLNPANRATKKQAQWEFINCNISCPYIDGTNNYFIGTGCKVRFIHNNIYIPNGYVLYIQSLPDDTAPIEFLYNHIMCKEYAIKSESKNNLYGKIIGNYFEAQASDATLGCFPFIYTYSGSCENITFANNTICKKADVNKPTALYYPSTITPLIENYNVVLTANQSPVVLNPDNKIVLMLLTINDLNITLYGNVKNVTSIPALGTIGELIHDTTTDKYYKCTAEGVNMKLVIQVLGKSETEERITLGEDGHLTAIFRFPMNPSDVNDLTEVYVDLQESIDDETGEVTPINFGTLTKAIIDELIAQGFVALVVSGDASSGYGYIRVESKVAGVSTLPKDSPQSVSLLPNCEFISGRINVLTVRFNDNWKGGRRGTNATWEEIPSSSTEIQKGIIYRLELLEN